MGTSQPNSVFVGTSQPTSVTVFFRCVTPLQSNMSGDGGADQDESDAPQFIMIRGCKTQIGEKIYMPWKGIVSKEKWLNRSVMIGGQKLLKESFLELAPAQNMCEMDGSSWAA